MTQPNPAVTEDTKEAVGEVVLRRALDFTLNDQWNKRFHLYETLDQTPLLLVFYPGDFKRVCTQQLCSYRDVLQDFQALGIQPVGISQNTTAQHAEFAQSYSIPFRLLSDTGRHITKAYGCSSIFMLGAASRAVTIVSQKKMQLYRYVERTSLTHRSADELLGVVRDLKSHGLL